MSLVDIKLLNGYLESSEFKSRPFTQCQLQYATTASIRILPNPLLIP